MLEGRREWSIGHMLSTVLAEACNPAEQPTLNDGGRCGSCVIHLVAQTVAHMRSSPTFKVQLPDVPPATQLFSSANLIPRSWVSMCTAMEGVLIAWDDIKQHYEANAEAFPLANHRAAVEEVYSVVKPVAKLIERTETLSPKAPAGVSSLVELATLRLTVAAPTKPLLVQIPRRGGDLACGTTRFARAKGGGGAVAAAEGEQQQQQQQQRQQHVSGNDGVGCGGVVIGKEPRAVAELDAATSRVRKGLMEGLDKDFFVPRYNTTLGEEGDGQEENDNGRRATDYLFEMMACMDPFLSQLTIVDSLACSPRRAAKVKSIVWDKVVTLASELAEAADKYTTQQRKNKRHTGEMARENSRSSYRAVDREREEKAMGKDNNDEEVEKEEDNVDCGNREVARSLDSPHTVTSPGSDDGDMDNGDDSLNGNTRKRSNEKCQRSTRGTVVVDAAAGHVKPKPIAAVVQPQESEDVRFILESGLFGQVSSPPQCRELEETHRERAEAELDSFKALGAKRTFGSPPLDGLLSFWGSAQGCGRFPYLARVARVLLSLPPSSRVSEMGDKLRGAAARMPSSNAAGAKGESSGERRWFAEMVLFLHLNRGLIPEDVPVLSQAEALTCVSGRRL